jgi:hypothetical protein
MGRGGFPVHAPDGNLERLAKPFIYLGCVEAVEIRKTEKEVV